MSRLRTETFVTLKVRVPTGVYNSSEAFDTIVSEAGKEGRSKITRLIQDAGGQVVGTPTVDTVTTVPHEEAFQRMFND